MTDNKASGQNEANKSVVLGTDVSTEQETLIEFPALLKVKAMGLNNDEFEGVVRDLVMPFIEPQKPSVSTQVSKNGKYLSVRIEFTAESHEQLLSVYGALRGDKRVLFAL